MVQIYNFLTSPEFQKVWGPVLLYVTTLFGSLAMYVFQLYKGFDGAKAFLRTVLPGRSETYYSRIDVFIVAIVGSIIGSILYRPTEPYEALMAGFGWTGAMQVLIAHRAVPGTPIPSLVDTNVR